MNPKIHAHHSFLKTLEQIPLQRLHSISWEASSTSVKRALHSDALSLDDFAALLSPLAENHLEYQARAAHELTVRRFGRVMQFFAPLYLSNECVNTCLYCGYSRELSIKRQTLELAQVSKEAEILRASGFRHILLVSGEHPKYISIDYLEAVIRMLNRDISSLSIEVAPLDEDAYRRLTHAGCEGLVVYQETYDREAYQRVHTRGPKKDYHDRILTAERGAAAGMRRIGIGILLGLSQHWKADVIMLAAHARFLMQHCWHSTITVSLPRLRPATGDERFISQLTLSDKQFVQIITALRLFLPDVGIVLSTRESPHLRDGLLPLGVTQISAGSRTEPGGYSNPDAAGRQFDIEDKRSPAAMAEVVSGLGYEPVFKDWEAVLHG